MVALTVHPILMPGAIVAVLLRLMGVVMNDRRNERGSLKTSKLFEQNQRRACCTINQSVSSLSRPDRAQQTAVITRNNAKKESQPTVGVNLVRKTMSPLTSSVERDVRNMPC